MPKCNAESYVSTNEYLLAPAACYCAPPSKQASFSHISPSKTNTPPSFPLPAALHSVNYVLNHDSGSLNPQFSFARTPRRPAYPRKSVSRLLPSQHIVPQPHLPSVSRDRSLTAESVQVTVECRLLRPLKKLADGCYVFPSP